MSNKAVNAKGWNCTCGGDNIHGCKVEPPCALLSDSEKEKARRVDAQADIVRQTEESREAHGLPPIKPGTPEQEESWVRNRMHPWMQRIDAQDRVLHELQKKYVACKPVLTSQQSVPDMLRAAASLYEERNKLYKNDYKEMGACLAILFPEGLRLDSPEDFNRFSLFRMIFAKATRYAKQFTEGGHPDSLDDLAVYSMMLAELDKEYAQ